MTACMHWRIELDHQPETITRTCVACGCSDTAPRCEVVKLNGERCKGDLSNGECRYHDEMTCQGTTAVGEPCHVVLRNSDQTHCSRHRSQSPEMAELEEMQATADARAVVFALLDGPLNGKQLHLAIRHVENKRKAGAAFDAERRGWISRRAEGRMVVSYLNDDNPDVELMKIEMQDYAQAQ